MYKFLFFILFQLFTLNIYGQSFTLKGRVVDVADNQSIPFANVYVNQTTNGTTSNENGEFELTFSQQNAEIIISYIGYEPIIYAVDVSKLNQNFVFKLMPREELLEEVVVNSKRDAVWYINLETFKEKFLGLSEFGKECEITNTDVLIIIYREKENVLEVKAREPLKIKNNLLGYEINYLLDHFRYEVSRGYMSSAGYPFYKEMEGGKGKAKKWEKNRLRAYNGSSLHFLRTLHTQNSVEEGFNLRRLLRLPNPNRPSDAEIDSAKKVLKLAGLNGMNSDTYIGARDIMRLARNPKFIEKLDTAYVPYAQYLDTTAQSCQLVFEGFFQIVYTGEKEELLYVQKTANMFGAIRKPTYQTSVISLTTERTNIDDKGNVSNPFDILYEGYWAWEKLGEMLPLGYLPPSE